jgi:hypothetical protein
MNNILQRKEEILQTCAIEYPEAGEEAIYQMAVDMKHLGWSKSEVNDLLAELGF